MKFILSLILVMFTAAPVFAQKIGSIGEFDAMWNINYDKNLVKNPSARVNDLYKVTSNAAANRDDTSGNRIDHKASWKIGAVLNGGYVQFTLNPESDEQTSGLCAFAGLFKGSDASYYAAQITDASGVVQGQVQLTANSGGFIPFITTAPCGAAGARRVRVTQIVAGTPAEIWVGKLFYGNIPSFSATVRTATDPASYTPTITNLGTSPSSSLQWHVDGTNIFITGTITCGTSLPGSVSTVSIPAGYTSASTLATNQVVGTWFRSTAAVNHGGSILMSASGNTFSFSDVAVFGSTSVGARTPANGSSICASSESLSVDIKIPIQGGTNRFAVTAQNWNFDWRPCPGAVTSTWTTNNSVTCKWKRQGGVGHFDISTNTTGTPGPSSGTSLVYTFWSGISFDTSRMSAGSSDAQILEGGAGSAIDTGVNTYGAQAVLVTSTQFRPILWSASGAITAATSLNPSTPFAFGNGDQVNIKFSAPIIENGVAWTETWNALQIVGTNNTPGINGIIETFSVNYGGSPITAACTGGTCNIDQIGNAVTSVTWTGTGAYTMAMPKTYTKLKCQGSAAVPGSALGIMNVVNCANCNSVAFSTTGSSNTTGANSIGQLTCQGLIQ